MVVVVRSSVRIRSFVMLLLVLVVARGVDACSDWKRPEAAEFIKVANTTWSYGEMDGSAAITTMGTLQNSSPAYVSDMVLEVTYRDATGTVIDTVTQRLYGLAIPPAEHMAFRVRDTPDKPKRAYASSTVRVMYAESYGGEPEPEPKSWRQRAPAAALAVLSDWSPMLFMIGVWLLVVRRFAKKKPPTIALIEEQNAIFAHQLAVLERLAAVAERGKGS